VRKLLDSLDGLAFILRPFGEAKRAPDAYIKHWLDLFEQYKSRSPGKFLVCLTGASSLLDKFAAHPGADLIDIYCYHSGRYDAREVNVPEGTLGIKATLKEAWQKYHKPVGKLYHKYGYPYADPHSPWADPKTGTQGGGPPSAGRQALWAVYEAGGFGCFFKMAWRRDRGAYLQPDAWSEDILEFWQILAQRGTLHKPPL